MTSEYLFTLPPPPLGASQIHVFSSEVDYEVSFDNGATFAPGSGTANVQVQVTHALRGIGPQVRHERCNR